MTLRGAEATLRLPRWLSRWLLGTGLVLLFLSAPFLGMALAEPEDNFPGGYAKQAELEIRKHEELHYAIHLTLGRVLSLCPCTRSIAAMQYRKAQPHAHTPRQIALVTDERPHSPKAMVRDSLRIAAVAIRVTGNRLLRWVEQPR